MPIAEHTEIRTLAHDFAVGELRPHTAAWDAARALDDEVFAKLADVGFLGMLVPEEHGGLAFDLRTYVAVLEELAWGDAAVALSVSIHNGPVCALLARRGSEGQKALWLPRLATGDAFGAFALSEPDAGSDPSSLSTRAVADGDGWRLTGRKRWVTNGARADLVLVFARTGSEDGAISVFLVDPASEGYRVTGREHTLGVRASETVSVALEGVRVGGDALLGEAGRGLAYALESIDLGRLGVAAEAVGIARAAMEHAASYALERRQFGRALAEFGATRAKLANMAGKVAAARGLVHDAAAAGGPTGNGTGSSRTGMGGITARAAMAKVVASEAATWVADEAVQIFGGYGYMRDYPVEKLLRDAKGTEIYEGTNEILRHVIAGEVLREARGD